MYKYSIVILAFIGGVSLAIQGGLNARLGMLLQSPLWASLVAFFCSTLYAIIAIVVSSETIPTLIQVKKVPGYLWYTGGLFSVIGISLYYYTIPKLGISTVISIGLCGQLCFAVIAGHYGWLHLPTEPITLQKVTGVIAMIIGIILIKIN